MFKVGVILGSSRTPRICPQISDYLVQSMKEAPNSEKVSFEIVDLIKEDLPMFNETTIPKMSNDYAKEHTKRWSEKIQQYNGVVIVAPQYNWGYPAIIKNAIDYLYKEWIGKPTMIVCYGRHGGLKCYEQLKDVCKGGTKMNVVDQAIALGFPSKEVVIEANSGKDMKLFESRIFKEHENDIKIAFEQLLGKMEEQ